MKLIIAEKPSLGRNIAAAIGNMQSRNGYMEGKDYIVSWAFGHLFSLSDVDYYAPNPDGSRRWCRETLPCFPKRFNYELKHDKDGKRDVGVEKQFKLLSDLCNRPDVDGVINAGDADREGEIIVRLIIDRALKAPKPVYRLWLPDQTAETVRASLAEMKEGKEYDLLAAEGYARTYIDWLYGMNFTRYATLRNGSLLRVGRVIVPIVRAIYDRDMAIAHFVPEKYYALVSRAETNGEMVELTSKKRFSVKERAEAERTAVLYNQTGARVTSVKNKKTTLPPGKLYSLSKLQSVLGKKYKMSMSDSLAIVQKLYEAGYLTYPRTNSEYLATAEKGKMRQIIAGVAKLGYPVKFKDGKSIFDDAKIESHSALTPTYKIPDPKTLTEAEKQVYSTVMRRFVAVFCSEDCVAAKSEIKIAVGELEEFVLKGMSILEKGWIKYDDSTQRDKILPALKEGDEVNIAFAPVEKETTPPKHYTIESLNQYLKNPFREEKAAVKEREENGEVYDDSEEYRAMFEGVELGTEATRTGIIDNARKSKYIDLKKDVYTVLPGGIQLIESLEDMQIKMDKYKTCELGRALKKVFRGAMTVEESVALAEKEIREVFENAAASEEENGIGYFGDVVGACPLCGKEVRRTSFGYGCSGYRDGCRFTVKMKILGKLISKPIVKMLLEDGKTPVLSGFVSNRTGKSFEASLRLEGDKVVFDFPPRDTATEVPPPPMFS